jgi:hypothetical protein
MDDFRKELMQDIIDVFEEIFLYKFGAPDLAEDTLRQLMKVDLFRQVVVRNRARRALGAGQLKTLEFNPEDMIVTKAGLNTIQHNLEGVIGDLSSARSARLVKPLSCLEQIRPLALNQRRNAMLQDIDVEVPLKLLCVGPRNEAEPLLLWSYGFSLENISSVDLISYSSLIQLADMHSLPFSSSTFDVIFSSCTLVYSKNILKAAEELKRVAKPGAIFAISQDIPYREYKKESIDLFGREYFSPGSIMELFFDISMIDVLYTHFAEANLDLPNGTTAACIFREKIS